MLDENTAQMSNDVQDEQTTQSDDNVDYKQLYLDEVQNAKKLRKRAQDSEIKNQEFLKAQETSKVKSMREQEKYKELSDTLQAQLDEVSPYKEKWESFEAKRKESLLAKLPEADREKLANKGIDTLEYIVSKIEENVPAKSEPISGVSRNIKDKPKGNIFAMSTEDRKKYWDSHMNDILNKITPANDLKIKENINSPTVLVQDMTLAGI